MLIIIPAACNQYPCAKVLSSKVRRILSSLGIGNTLRQMKECYV